MRSLSNLLIPVPPFLGTHCLSQFKEADLYTIRSEQADMSPGQLSQARWLAFRAALKIPGKKRFCVNGSYVCMTAFCAIIGLHLKQG